MITKTQAEDLDAMTASKGWAILADRARAECAARKDKGVKDAANVANDVSALHTLRQVLAFEKGVQFVLDLPGELMTQSERLALPMTFDHPSRRGPL